jgi:hypothetical protein
VWDRMCLQAKRVECAVPLRATDSGSIGLSPHTIPLAVAHGYAQPRQHSPSHPSTVVRVITFSYDDRHEHLSELKIEVET